MDHSSRSKAILFVSLVIVMLGFGIAIPLLPFYVTHFNASAGALGLMMSLYSLMQFIFAPLWGRWSDRVGRKPVIIIGIVGYFISFILQGVSQNIIQLTLARMFAGMITSATLPTAMAFIADTTAERDRAKGMGLMGAAMGLGMIFGPLLGGALTGISLPLPDGINHLLQVTHNATTGEVINLSIPFFASALLALIAVPFIAFLLPESLPPEKRGNQPEEHVRSRLQQMLGGLNGPNRFLFLMTFLLAFALANIEAVLGMYGQERFSMSPAEIGMIMGGMGILSVIQQGLVIGPLTRKLGEERVIQVGLVISIAGFLMLAVIGSKWMMALSALVFSFGNVLLQPSVTALLSRRVKGGQGAVMGLNNSFQSLGRGVGPLWAGFAYDIYTTLSFWTGALIQLIALVVSLRMLGESEIKMVGQEE